MTHIAPPANPSECSDCGVQLNADGTVDALDGESDSHFADCTAMFTVVGRAGDDELRYDGPNGKPFGHYGPARDIMRQRRAMTGKRITWTIETIIP